MKVLLNYFLTLFFVLTSISSFAQNLNVGYKSDWLLFRDTLESYHPGLYRFTPKAEFDHLLDSVENVLNSQKIDDLNFYQMLAKVESSIAEFHTYTEPSKDLLQDVTRKKLLPFKVWLDDEKLVITESWNKEYDFLIGSQILSVNEVDIKDLKKLLSERMGCKTADNLNGQHWVLSQGNNFSFAYHIFIDRSSQFDIEYLNVNGDQRSILIDGVVNNTQSRFPKMHKKTLPSLTLDRKESIAVLKMNTFQPGAVDGMTWDDFRKFIDKSFLKIHQAKVENLVLDLRGNSGGNPGISRYLLSFLAVDTFKMEVSDHWNTLKVVPTSKHHFNGKVIFLCDGGTNSAATQFLALAHTYKIGRIIGSESGGSFKHIDGVYPAFQLPFSKHMVSFSQVSSITNSNGGNPRRGVIPDQIIVCSSEDLVREQDPVLKFALNQF